MSQCSTGLGRRMGTIRTAADYSGVSRSRLYLLAGTTPGLFRKFGRTVLVDFSVLDQILDNLPNANIKPLAPAAVDTTATRIARSMSQHEETPGRGFPGASELHSAGKLEFSEDSPGQDQKQGELPLVVEARARDLLARAKLRGLIPRTMAALEDGKHWRKAEELRTAVFGDAPKEGGAE